MNKLTHTDKKIKKQLFDKIKPMGIQAYMQLPLKILIYQTIDELQNIFH